MRYFTHKKPDKIKIESYSEKVHKGQHEQENWPKFNDDFINNKKTYFSSEEELEETILLEKPKKSKNKLKINCNSSTNEFQIKNHDLQTSWSKHQNSTDRKKIYFSSEEQLDEINPVDSNYQKPKKNRNKFKTDSDEDTKLHQIVVQIPEFKKRTYLLMKFDEKWYDQDISNVTTNSPQPEELISELQNRASVLLQDEVELYQKKFQKERVSDYNWIRTIIRTGTISDKAAALTLMVQDSPLHNLYYIDLLLGMCKKNERGVKLLGLGTFKDLLLSNLLPDNRKLKIFSQRPLNQLEEISSGNKDSYDKYLMYWYFEHQLKERYLSFLKILETTSVVDIENNKIKTMAFMYILLMEKPEQEQLLLSMLINKFGDPVAKIASRTVHYLNLLLSNHSRMKAVIVAEVERFLYRPNITDRSQFYAVCFLNNLVFDEEDGDLAAQLLTLYMSFFKLLVTKKTVDSRMLSALLVGVNRAFPYTKGKTTAVIDETSTLFKLVQTSSFVVSIQTLMLLYHLLEIDETFMDHFYITLYHKLRDCDDISVAHQTLFLNLVFKSLKRDTVIRRIKAFVKRLLQMCNYHQPPLVCGILILISEIKYWKPEIMNLTKSQEDSDDEEYFVDIDSSNSDNDDKKNSIEQKQSSTPSWVHRENATATMADRHSNYDTTVRNPLYCGGDYCVFWELQYLSKHFHPSVALFAEKVIKGDRIGYTGDPIEDFSVSKFLEKFIYRNPKQTGKKFTSFHEKKKVSNAQNFAIHSKNYSQLNEKNLLPHELFLYKYFKETESLRTPKHESDSEDGIEDDSDHESISDEEFDRYLDKLEGTLKITDENLDFLGDFEKEKGKKKKQIESEDDDDDLDDDGIEVGENFEELMQNIELSENDDDEAEIDEDMDTDDSMEVSQKQLKSKKTKKIKKQNKKHFEFHDGELDEMEKPAKTKSKKLIREEDFQYSDDEFGKATARKKKYAEIDNLFEAAEKFSNIIAADKYDTSGTDAFSNKDKSSKKQLKWEMERDKWMRGVDWKSKKRMRRKPIKKPFFKRNTNKKVK